MDVMDSHGCHGFVSCLWVSFLLVDYCLPLDTGLVAQMCTICELLPMLMKGCRVLGKGPNGVLSGIASPHSQKGSVTRKYILSVFCGIILYN